MLSQMSQISQSYSGVDATLEIIIMLGVMLILWYILGRLTAPKYQKISQAEIPSAIKAVPAQKSQNVKTSVKKARSDDLSVIEGIGPKRWSI